MSDGGRRTEILDTAAALFAERGLRTSLKDIADACGILPGSLYHHFDSKEAIFGELVERYRHDLEGTADAARHVLDQKGASPIAAQVIDFGQAIALCGVRHRAALFLTMYELPPAEVDAEGTGSTWGAPAIITAAMRDLLEAGQVDGTVRPDLDLGLLAERFCQSMLHYAVGDSYLAPGAATNPALRCRILFEGLARAVPPYAELDRSAALSCANDLVMRWEDAVEDPRVAEVRLAAKSVFGRRGYTATGMRDVAAAAGVASSAVYRHFDSKEALLASVIRPYTEERHAAWDAVLGSTSSPLEKLDALTWVNIILLDRFSDEVRIQSAWLRDSPPNIRKLGSTAGQRRDIRALLTSGEQAGELRFAHGSVQQKARCVYEALWTPENIVRTAGTTACHILARTDGVGWSAHRLMARVCHD